jgi:hypothetical protein
MFALLIPDYVFYPAAAVTLGLAIYFTVFLIKTKGK